MTAPAVEIPLVFRGSARRFLSDKSPELGLVGSAGTGKTTVALWKMHLASLISPGCRSLLSRKEGTSLTATTLQTFNRYVVADAISQGLVSWYGGSQREPAAFHYRNGSTIQVSGLDRPEKIMSAEFDRILVDEGTDIPESTYEMLTTRLRGSAARYRQIMVCCNPQHPTHWMKLRGDAGRLNLMTSLHIDNPRFYHPNGEPTAAGVEYMKTLSALTGVRRLRLLQGIWAAAEGVIYDTFSPTHIVDTLPAGWETWETYWVVDFGFTNPFVWQEWAVDGDGRAWLVREIYRTRRTVVEHCAVIKELTKGRPRPRRIICDHDAEDRATMEHELGFSTQAADKRVSVGLQAVMARLAPPAAGLRPRLMFYKGALHSRDQALVDAGKPASTVEEFPGYIWNDAKDAPVKENDHGMDTTRYLVTELDLRGETRVRTHSGRPRRR